MMDLLLIMNLLLMMALLLMAALSFSFVIRLITLKKTDPRLRTRGGFVFNHRKGRFDWIRPFDPSV